MHKDHHHIRPARSPRSAVKALASVLQRAFADRPGTVIVAIGGPGGTGKSTLSHDLAVALQAAAVLPLDDYKTPRHVRAQKKIYGPHPEANELALIGQHLAAIRRHEPFERPVYCRDAGRARSSERFTPARFTIVDGEVSTYPQFREWVDFAIFVDSDWKTQLNTRVERDVEQRGYSTDKAIATFLHSNLREFATYGADSKRWADAHIYCHDDYRLELESIADPY